ncbi:MAG: energy transducer TonB [Saprospiraceae bacterium]|nr:energy transducer TonB [Saprospiraceae bacterium]
MKRCMVFLLLFSPLFVFGKKTKEITDEQTREVYNVLKSDQSIRHGDYQKFSYSGKLLAKGRYSTGQKEGIWDYYDYYGNLIQQYDYSKNEFIFLKNVDKDKVFKVVDGDSVVDKKLDRPPLYLGGEVIMMENVFRNIRYPVEARNAGVSGKVILSFIVGKDGLTYGHKVVKGIGYGCDEEALRVVKEIPDNWAPGILNGQAVSIQFILPIQFKIQ